MPALASLPFLIALALPPQPARAGQNPDAPGRLQAALIYAGLGVAPSLSHAAADGRSADAASVALDYSSVAYLNLKRLSGRYRQSLRLGAGESGLEAGASLDLRLGYLWPVTAHSGLVARAGPRAYVYGNRRMYASLLELPAFEAGYQWLPAEYHVELLAQAGLSLIGRHRALDHAATQLGGAGVYGARAALGFRTLHAELGWSDLGNATYRSELTLCALVTPVALCGELTRLVTNERDFRGQLQPFSSQVLGLRLSLIKSERK
jgi:hypothetical protein